MLILLLANNDHLRSEMLASGQNLTRNELEQRVSRDAFWADIVAPVLNDKNVEFTGHSPNEVDEVDLFNGITTILTDEELKRKYSLLRSHFTYAYESWSKSGQNGTQNFPNYCELSSSTGSLTACCFRILCRSESAAKG